MPVGQPGNNKLKRNYAIDAIKILFAVSVAMGHFQYVNFLSSNTIVQVFFILSGYFLMHSYQGSSYKDAYVYTKQRIKRMYPYYLTSFLILFLYLNRQNLLKPMQLLRSFCNALPELLFLQNLGIFNGGINYPLWQLCVLIFVSYIWFALLSWDEKITVHVFCPLLAVAVITFLANVYNTHTVDIFTVENKFFYVPLLRAAGFVGLGIFLHNPIAEAVYVLNCLKYKRLILSVIGIISAWIFYEHQWDYISHIAFVMILICCFSTDGIIAFLFNRRIFAIGEKLSLSIYMNHAFVIYAIRDLVLPLVIAENIDPQIINAIFVAVLLMFSLLFVQFVDLIQHNIQKRN